MHIELSIDELEPTGVLSTVSFDGRRWTMTYDTVRSALVDAVTLGMLEDATEYMDGYRAEPNDWNLFAILPPHFEEAILRLHGWTQEPTTPPDAGKWIM